MTEFREASPADLSEIREFLARVFETGLTAPFLEPRLMHWKYFEPRPDWTGSRAFLLRKDGRLIACAGIVPAAWLTPNGPVQGFVPIDWAASVPGAGAVLHRKLARLASVVFQIGGTEPARKVAPLLNLRPAASLVSFVRVTRPWRQHRTRPDRGWKALPRLARNIGWSLGAAAPGAGWRATPVERFENRLITGVATGGAIPARDPGLLNYMLACPAARMRGYQILEDGRPRGWFLLSRVGGQARIADLRVNSDAVPPWRSAYALAANVAASDPETCEVVAAASDRLALAAVRDAGFRPCESDPVWIGDPEGRLAGAPLHLSMLESDAAWLCNPSRPFLA